MKLKRYNVYIAFLLAVNFTFSYASDSLSEFKEIVEQADCLTKNGSLNDALDLYSKANSIPLHEGIKFDLYAKIARIYMLKGNSEQYNAFKDKYLLALSIYTDIYKCSYENGMFLILDKYGRKVESPHNEVIAVEMCVGEKEHYLVRDHVKRLDDELYYFKLYESIKY